MALLLVMQETRSNLQARAQGTGQVTVLPLRDPRRDTEKKHADLSVQMGKLAKINLKVKKSACKNHTAYAAHVRKGAVPMCLWGPQEPGITCFLGPWEGGPSP